MSEIFRPQLAPQTFPAFNAVGDTGDRLQLSQLPAQVDGRAVYVRGFNLRVLGTVTVGAATTINWSQMFSAVYLDIPGVKTIINSVSGNKLARLFRTRNFGETPPFGLATGGATNPWTTVAAQLTGNSVNNVDITFPIEFSDVGQRRFDDNAIPAALLQIAKLKVTFAKMTDLQAAITATSLQLIVTPVMYAKADKQLGCLPVIDSVDIVGTQPPISPIDGKMSNILLQPQGDSVFANGTDYTQVGLGYGGTLVQTDDGTPVDIFYDQFNRYAVVAMPKHTVTQLDPTASIPFWYPPGGHQGEHSTFEMVPAGYQPRLKTNTAAATAGYTWTYRYLLDQRSAPMQAARKLLGIVAPKAKTASKKPTVNPDVAAYVPAKSAA